VWRNSLENRGNGHFHDLAIRSDPDSHRPIVEEDRLTYSRKVEIADISTHAAAAM
jgi:hypothetical protein